MAATGTISGRGSKGHHTYDLTLTEGSYDITANTSPVSYSFVLTDDNNWFWNNWGDSIQYTINIGGNTITGSIPSHLTKTQTIKTGSVTIAHDDDGSKTIAYSFSVTDSSGQSYTSGTASASDTLTLTTIPRASSMALSPADPTTISTITATITRASDSFSHTITTAYGGTNYTLSAEKFTTLTTTFTIPTGIRTAMKTANVASTVLPLTITTYNGNEIIGTKDYSLTIKAPVATVTCSPASVACNANTTWTLVNYDTTACTYTVTRSYNNEVRYTDQTKGTTTTKSNAANSTFETLITAATSGTVTIRVITYIGTTEVGSNTVDYTVTIPTGTYKPTLTVASQLSRVNKVSYTYRTGITYLSGYDGATGTMTEGVSNSSHSPIVSRTVTVSGNKATATTSTSGPTTTVNVETFESSNEDYTATVTLRITDARGAYAELAFTSITVRGYSKPTFNSYSVVRANSSGVVSAEGTYANISALASAHSVKNTSNVEVNSMASINFKIGAAGTAVAGTVSGLNGTIDQTGYNRNLNIAQQYTFILTATDYLGLSTTVNFVVEKAIVTLSLHKNNGVGLGTVAEEGYLVSNLVSKGIFLYGTCTTASGTAAKVATLETGMPFNRRSLIKGTTIFIKFSEANGIANPTLNVNGTGAIAIKRYGTTAPSTASSSSWNRGSVVSLVYDGTYWQQVGFLNNNTTYSVIAEADIKNSAQTTGRLITGQRYKQAFDYYITNLTGKRIFREADVDITLSDNGLTNYVDNAIGAQDINHNWYSFFANYAGTNGLIKTEMYALNQSSVDNTMVTARLGVGVSKSGEGRYYVSHPDVFRSVIHVDKNIVWCSDKASYSIAYPNSALPPKVITKQLGSAFTISDPTNGGNIICGRTGTVRVTAKVFAWCSVSNGGAMRCYISQNGTDNTSTASTVSWWSNGIAYLDAIIDVTADDVLNVNVYNDSGTGRSISVQAASSFIVEYLEYE